MDDGKRLDCSGTLWGPCSGDVTHIDCTGFVYCATHGKTRRESGVRCRMLRPHELRRLKSGAPLARY